MSEKIYNAPECTRCRCHTIEATCPECGHAGLVHVSTHMYFDKNRLGYRCRKCKHVWCGDEDGDL